MNDRKTDVNTVTRLGILTAVALVLGYIEHLIPITAIPGIKLGLANTVLLYALYLLDTKSATLLMLLKVGLSGILFGGFAAMIYSLAGGVVSLVTMIMVKKMKGVSVIGVSICGAAAHNIGQLVVACFVVETRAVLAYLPVLLVAAAITGMLTGIVAKYTFRGLERGNGGADKNARREPAQNQEIQPSKKQG